DALAVQAVNALAEKQLAGKVCVVGQDADVEACQKVVEGLQSMTVYKDVDLLAKTAAQYSVMLAQELDLTGVTDTVKSGNYTVKTKLLEPIAVTKNNMDEVIIGSGFHMEEDVYLNMAK
ncbi:MAG: substrate-binding domain-containing protein, partial [Lachnospiraceae bacterium]